MSKKPVKLFLAVTTEIARCGLQSILANDPTIEIVGCASEMNEAVSSIRELRPDVIVLNFEMSASETLEVVSRIKQQSNASRFLLLGACGKDRLAQLLQAGVFGYGLLDTCGESLKMAIHSVASSAIWIAPSFVHLLIEPPSELAFCAYNYDPKELISPLTIREKEVLRLLVEGMSNLQIAQALSLSVETIKCHMRHIMEKFSAHGRTQVVIKAVQGNLLQSPKVAP